MFRPWIMPSKSENSPPGVGSICDGAPVIALNSTSAARDGGTEVTVEHVQIHDERSKTEHAAGWAACLDRLAAYA
jgi:hypothetical protein